MTPVVRASEILIARSAVLVVKDVTCLYIKFSLHYQKPKPHLIYKPFLLASLVLPPATSFSSNTRVRSIIYIGYLILIGCIHRVSKQRLNESVLFPSSIIREGKWEQEGSAMLFWKQSWNVYKDEQRLMLKIKYYKEQL